MPKRFRTPKAKEGELLVKYGKSGGELDLMYCWPDNDYGMKHDAKLLMHAIEREAILLNGKSLRHILTERGYDITTLTFSIKKR